MTSYFQHLVGYCVFAAALTYALINYQTITEKDLFAVAVGLGLGAAGCLIPDIDSPSSKARKILNILFLAATIALASAYVVGIREDWILYAIILLAATQLSLWFLKHRGFTHNPLIGIVLAAVVAYFSGIAGLYFLTGYLSHLFLDAVLKN